MFNLCERVEVGRGGTGAGLALVRKLVERMGGRVGVESEAGHGSRFRLKPPPKRWRRALIPGKTVEGVDISP